MGACALCSAFDRRYRLVLVRIQRDKVWTQLSKWVSLIAGCFVGAEIATCLLEENNKAQRNVFVGFMGFGNIGKWIC